jgi:hypothetical protein
MFSVNGKIPTALPPLSLPLCVKQSLYAYPAGVQACHFIAARPYNNHNLFAVV